MTEHYHIEASRDRVEVWSDARMPFEPKTWKREMRDALRLALREMRSARSGELLEAVYTSEDCSFCDLENVLCYNVGPSVFHHLVTSGFLMKRESRSPSRRRHHCSYAFTDSGCCESTLPRCNVVAEWSFVASRLRGDVKPEFFWATCKRGSMRTPECELSLEAKTELGVTLELPAQPGYAVHVANIIKPLLDGVLCAFHVHDGSDLEELSRRISYRLNDTTPADVQRLLTEGVHAILGRRKLARRFREAIQWNPADDRFTCIELRMGPPTTTNLCHGLIWRD